METSDDLSRYKIFLAVAECKIEQGTIDLALAKIYRAGNKITFTDPSRLGVP